MRPIRNQQFLPGLDILQRGVHHHLRIQIAFPAYILPLERVVEHVTKSQHKCLAELGFSIADADGPVAVWGRENVRREAEIMGEVWLLAVVEEACVLDVGTEFVRPEDDHWRYVDCGACGDRTRREDAAACSEGG
jgi:hypothetical protein